MVDTEDPVGAAAALMSFENFVMLAYSQPRLFHRLLEKLATPIYERTRKTSADLPGRLWRICGAEYITEPFLPPAMFKEYVVRYTAPIVDMIHEHRGLARIHCHGRIKAVLDYIAGMNADAIDPIEPPPQGDASLEYVRKNYGKQFTLFGNIEFCDIVNTPPDNFEGIVRKSLREGTGGSAKGFVLMPSASPTGRKISKTTLANYKTMLRLARNFCY